MRSLVIHRRKDVGWHTLRHFAQTQLYTNEHFTCLIDSTTHLCDGWDVALMDMYKKLYIHNGIITTMLPAHNLIEQHKPTYMVFEQYSVDKLPIMQNVMFQRTPSKNYMSVGWSSSFSFGPSRMFRDAPFDPS